MKMKLTAAAVGRLKLPPGKSDDIVFDTAIHGFGVRLRDGGNRSFIYQYKLGSKQRRLTIGSVAAVDFGTACRTAKDLYAQVRLGRDPAGERVRAKLKATETFEAVVTARYLGHKRRELRPQPFKDVERHLLQIRKAAPPLAAGNNQQKRHSILSRCRSGKCRPYRRQPRADLAVGPVLVGDERRPRREQSGRRHPPG
jgi:Arm DNA-binding domain